MGEELHQRTFTPDELRRLLVLASDRPVDVQRHTDVQHAIDEAMRSPAVVAAALMRLSSRARDNVRVLLDALEADGLDCDGDKPQIVRAVIDYDDGSRQTVTFERAEPAPGEGG